jgi:hypothetical protein
MAELLTTPQAELLRSLFAPAERWGWEYRDPATVPLVFPHPRPVPHPPPPTWAAELAPRLEQAEQTRVLLAVGAATSLLIALSIGLGSPFWSLLFLAAAAGLGWLGLVRPRLLRRQAADRQRQWMEACVEHHDRYFQQLQSWTAAREEHRRREHQRLAASPAWAALRPWRMLERLDVFGGTAYGWEALVTAAGASLLGGGARLTVVDLSHDAVAAELAQLAALRGCGVDVVVLPRHMEELDLFAGLRPGEVRDVLVEALHGDEREASHEARSIDGRVLGELCETLGAPLTLGRICAALGVLLRHGRSPDGAGELDPDECRRIANLFGATARASMEPRMVALESRLHGLRRLGRRPGGRPLSAADAQLRVVALDQSGSDLVDDVLSHLLLQVLIHAARDGNGRRPGGDALLVAGADALRRRHLERLDQLARQRGIRLVYMFRHLRDETVDLLGSGGAVIFMRLGNAREAMHAAEFIGREHKFVLHQLTRSTGESVTHTTTDSVTDTTGTSTSTTRSDLLRTFLPVPLTDSYTSGRSGSRAWGQSSSLATGTTTGASSGQQRVYELAVEPTTLQTLPQTAVVFVDHEARRGPRARLGDCNPDIVTLPNVSAEPFDP